MKILIVFFACFLVVGDSLNLAHQQANNPWDIGPAHCYDNTAVLDVTTQEAAPNVVITVVARLGDGEDRPNLNQRRLHNVRAYWTEYLTHYGARRRPETIISVEGERIEGYGCVEFHISGRLVGRIRIGRNRDLSVCECYPPDDSYIRRRGQIRVYDSCWVERCRNFYPCLDRRVRNRRRR